MNLCLNRINAPSLGMLTAHWNISQLLVSITSHRRRHLRQRLHSVIVMKRRRRTRCGVLLFGFIMMLRDQQLEKPPTRRIRRHRQTHRYFSHFLRDTRTSYSMTSITIISMPLWLEHRTAFPVPIACAEQMVTRLIPFGDDVSVLYK